VHKMIPMLHTEQERALELQVDEPENENILWIGETGFEADADKLIVVVDEFRSGHECLTCLAKDIRMVSADKQVSFVACPECAGIGRRPKVGNKAITVKCTDCDGKGAVPCPECGGRGGLIAIPQKSEGSPQTGKIVSIGPHVPIGKRKVGDRVMFSSYSGSRYDVTCKRDDGSEAATELRILRDDEVLTKLYGFLKFRNLKRSMALHTNA
jgi:co-chaperonin GroES (HSP10)